MRINPPIVVEQEDITNREPEFWFVGNDGAYLPLTCHDREIAKEIADTINRDRKVLLFVSAAKNLCDLIKKDGEGFTEHFERIAEIYHNETGLLRPGKDVPPQMSHAPKGHFDEWIRARQKALITALEAL